jgi:hypothetical protein
MPGAIAEGCARAAKSWIRAAQQESAHVSQLVFESRMVARTEIFEFIEVFYNRQRAHQTLAYKTPLRVEQKYQMVA